MDNKGKKTNTNKASIYNSIAWIFAILFLVIIAACIYYVATFSDSCKGNSGCGAGAFFVTITAIPALLITFILAIIFSHIAKKENNKNNPLQK